MRDLPEDVYEEYALRHDEIPGLFLSLEPIENSIESVLTLNKHFELFILSTPSWGNSESFSEKINWIKNLYGDNPESPFYKRIILSHRKDLLIGDYLIDDRVVNGAKDFIGEFIHFGSPGFDTWKDIVKYILSKEGKI
jgi:5'-nucleotidase